jgi:hypothetical protein
VNARDRDPKGQEDKRSRRLARKEEEQRARLAAQRRGKLLRGAAWVVGGALVVVVGWMLFGPDPEIDGVQRPSNEGREHIAQGVQVDYDHPAPTSGPHWAAAPPCRAYGEPLDLELAVHALEHGVVIVWHRPDLQDETVDALWDRLRGWDSHVIVSPNPGIDDPVVATAWNRRMSFEGPGDDLDEFIDVYRQRGPERVDCPNVR